MTDLQFFDNQGLSHMSNQGIIELAYQNKLSNPIFEWQDSIAKQNYQKISNYLDSWPFEINSTDTNGRSWFTPEEYANIDLDEYVLARCKDQKQRSRALEELRIIHELHVEHIFCHLIYLVTLWRAKNLVWGIGRGSSVSCFVLYAIGLNKINPLDFDLDYREFFKQQ